MPKRRLGKGLEAIIRNTNFLEIEGEKDELLRLPIRLIRPNRFQPRREFSEKSISELADSIRENGIVQPLLVRQAEDGYELVIGERRLRAAQKLELETVPCILVEVEDRELLEIALVENVQREDLNPIEEGMAYRALMNRFGLSQTEVASRIGKNRSTVANAVRLLRLPEKIREYLQGGRLTGGHARAILAVEGNDKQIALAERILKENLSVREAEEMSKERIPGRSRLRRRTVEPRIAALENAFQAALGTMVRIKVNGPGRGKLEINFYSDDDLNRLCDLFGVEI